MPYHAGFEAVALVNGVDLNVVKWDGTSTTQEIDVTTTANYDAPSNKCYTDFIRGTTSFEGTLMAIFDDTKKPWPTLRDGSYIALELQCDKTGSKISMQAFVRSLKVAPTEISGRVEVEVGFRNKGTVTYT